MTAEEIRNRGVDIRQPGTLEAFKVEILQELTAQVAELNESTKEIGTLLFELTNGTRSLSVYGTDVSPR